MAGTGVLWYLGSWWIVTLSPHPRSTDPHGGPLGGTWPHWTVGQKITSTYNVQTHGDMASSLSLDLVTRTRGAEKSKLDGNRNFPATNWK